MTVHRFTDGPWACISVGYDRRSQAASIFFGDKVAGVRDPTVDAPQPTYTAI